MSTVEAVAPQAGTTAELQAQLAALQAALNQERRRTDALAQMLAQAGLDGDVETALAALLAQHADTEDRDRLQFALQSGRLGSWDLDVETRTYLASDLCKANYGRTPDQDFSFDDLVASIHPDDRSRMMAAMDEAIRTGCEYDIEYRVLHPSGEVRWLHARGRAAKTAHHGGVRRLAGVSLDVTERRRADERQRLLINELNHRVKNTLATVQSIASQSLRGASDVDAFRHSFEARLLALSKTHDLLTARSWEAASLHDILLMEVSPHAGGREGGGSRFRLVSDRDVQLSAKAAVALGMAFHELATNALKYGSLSTPTGLVEVRTQVAGAPGDQALTIEWIESGGPPVAPPTRRGFGGRVLKQGLAGELAGDVQLDYRPEGLSCRIRIPMHALEPTQ
jgi:two-component sensor histidine kinase/PAS domain-containing protein